MVVCAASPRALDWNLFARYVFDRARVESFELCILSVPHPLPQTGDRIDRVKLNFQAKVSREWWQKEKKKEEKEEGTKKRERKKERKKDRRKFYVGHENPGLLWERNRTFNETHLFPSGRRFSNGSAKWSSAGGFFLFFLLFFFFFSKTIQPPVKRAPAGVRIKKPGEESGN